MDKKLIILCHCILNSYSKVENFEDRAPSHRLAIDLLKAGYAIIQLPCPENIIFGQKRWGHVKEQFDTPFYREQCRNMLKPYILQIEDYINCGYTVEGVVSIEGSPSCGNSLTCSSDRWFGEFSSNPDICQCMSDVKMVNDRGIFMQEVLNMFKEHDLKIPVLELTEDEYTSLDDLKKSVF